jgi:hypothetical protein
MPCTHLSTFTHGWLCSENRKGWGITVDHDSHVTFALLTLTADLLLYFIIFSQPSTHQTKYNTITAAAAISRLRLTWNGRLTGVRNHGRLQNNLCVSLDVLQPPFCKHVYQWLLQWYDELLRHGFGRFDVISYIAYYFYYRRSDSGVRRQVR